MMIYFLVQTKNGPRVDRYLHDGADDISEIEINGKMMDVLHLPDGDKTFNCAIPQGLTPTECFKRVNTTYQLR